MARDLPGPGWRDGIAWCCVGLLCGVVGLPVACRHIAMPPPDHAVGLQLDLNTADRAALQLLPRVGASLADKIILEREERGPFESVDDLLRVRGVGPKKISAMRPYVNLSKTAKER